ncbi:MAG: ribonuclease D [Rhodospirillaceae bacterium]|nr:ribonuclease D [Rhodospirillaceae bacterium]|tara:strand:- start:258 stop:1421 length:1164 start_codon:yes stop_codon:yes gene_type:complete
MTIITDSVSLATLCDKLTKEPFICIDTEFIREKTYWPKLCLVQISGPKGEPFAIDPLHEGIDLSPLFSLMINSKIVKVLHAARQDIEIFLHLIGQLPNPIFDTQVAAMVCGFGESASYEHLARKIADARIDKSSRFSDWSGRPLEKRQLKYALSDVIHLPRIYLTLKKRLAETGRESWIAKEMAALGKQETYITEPKTAWKKIKTRGASSRTLAVLRELAAVREEWAILYDLPRQHVIRDQSLLAISVSQPTTMEELVRVRGLKGTLTKGKLVSSMLKAIERGKNLKLEKYPETPRKPDNHPASPAVVDLLKVLLKVRCDENSIAAPLVAKNSDLIEIAAGLEKNSVLTGWRRKVFGEDALKLIRGQLSLRVNNGEVHIHTSCEKKN